MADLFEGLEFEPLQKAHIEPLTAIMRRAFDDDAQRYFGQAHGGPDGYDDGSFLRRWGLEEGAHAYAVRRDGQLAGCIILFVQHKRQEGFLGCLFIDPAFHHQGLGRTAWRFAEHRYPDIRIWRTETPAVSFRNHCFYINTCGFHVVRVNDPEDRLKAQFALEKRMDP